MKHKYDYLQPVLHGCMVMSLTLKVNDYSLVSDKKGVLHFRMDEMSKAEVLDFGMDEISIEEGVLDFSTDEMFREEGMLDFRMDEMSGEKKVC